MCLRAISALTKRSRVSGFATADALGAAARAVAWAWSGAADASAIAKRARIGRRDTIILRGGWRGRMSVTGEGASRAAHEERRREGLRRHVIQSWRRGVVLRSRSGT